MPRITALTRRRLFPLAQLLAGAVFLLDLGLSQDASVGLLYVLVLLLGLWTPRRTDVLHLAILATILGACAFVFSGRAAGGRPWAVPNGLLEITVVWVTACGIHLFRRTLHQRELAERHAQRSDRLLREQSALAQVGQMAAVVAHEVRNPLAGIRNAVQILSHDLPEPSQEREIAQDAISRIDTLNGIIGDLLQFARPIRPVVAPTTFESLIRPTVALLHEDAQTRGVTVDITGHDVLVNADPQLMKLILHNLLLNSAQALNGTGAIRISAAIDGGACEIRVVDRGPGIPADVRSHLFEPFFTTKTRGTGLGLATVRRLVQAHGGTVEISCPAEGGTSVLLTLPAQVAEAA